MDHNDPRTPSTFGTTTAAAAANEAAPTAAAAAAPTGLSSTGMRTFVEGKHDGPTIVFVHGWPDDHTMWDYQVCASYRSKLQPNFSLYFSSCRNSFDKKERVRPLERSCSNFLSD